MKNKVTIIYASQTGQAQAIAESINDSLLENDFDVTLFCASDNGEKFVINELKDPVVFISSTTGDGEPPENGLKLFNMLKRLKANPDENQNFLKNFDYALLGLGDSNYAQFCNGPKSFHKKFQELGANCFYGPFWADDGVGLELEVEPFKDGLIDALLDFYAKKASQPRKETPSTTSVADKFNQMRIHVFTNEELKNIELNVPVMPEKHISISFGDALSNEPLETGKLVRSIHSANIFDATVVENKLITSADAVKSCYDLKFVSSSGTQDVPFTYQAGHSIDVISKNDDEEIQLLLKRLEVNAENLTKIVKLTSEDSTKKTGAGFVKMSRSCDMNIRTFFTYCVDVRTDSLKKATLRMLAEYSQDEKDQRRLLELCSREGSAQYQTLVKENQLSLLDVLNIFQSCKPPIDFLIQLLSPLASRPYSLCSVSQDVKTPLEFVYNLVEFESDSAKTYKRSGVATGYLSRLKPNDTFYFSQRTLQVFTLPEEAASKNVLMFGPGTGIAPFIGFLRQKKSTAASGESSNSSGYWWLFYGCRDPSKDFLFKEELAGDLSNQLAKFSVSFSRFSYDANNNTKKDEEHPVRRFHEPNTKYIMDIIRAHKKQLADLIRQPETYVYVCGDANNMSKDIMNALTECLSETEGFTAESAKAFLFDMMKNKRYKQEVWA